MTKSEIMRLIMEHSHRYYEYIVEEDDVKRDKIFKELADLYSEIYNNLDKIEI